jgi:hypothetical protein
MRTLLINKPQTGCNRKLRHARHNSSSVPRCFIYSKYFYGRDHLDPLQHGHQAVTSLLSCLGFDMRSSLKSFNISSIGVFYHSNLHMEDFELRQYASFAVQSLSTAVNMSRTTTCPARQLLCDGLLPAFSLGAMEGIVPDNSLVRVHNNGCLASDHAYRAL